MFALSTVQAGRSRVRLFFTPRAPLLPHTPRHPVADHEAGGPQLCAIYLSPELFEAAAMEAVSKDLMEMKVAELKEELEAHGELTAS